MFPPMNRREVLRLAGAGLAMAPMAPLQALAQTATGGYRALVCLFLYGGNDSNNLIVPTDTTPYGVYRATRPNLAIPREQLLPLAPTNTGGATYGLHPAMPGLQQLFTAGKAAFVANVGPLMVPTSKAQWSQRSVPLPMNLFSHSDQQGIWQSAIAAENARHGWGGRLLERLIADNAPRRGYAALSVAGNNTWEAGDRTLQAYRISALGEFGFSFFDPEGTDILSMEINAMLSEQRADPFEQTWVDVMGRSVENQKIVSNAIGGLNLATPFPNTGLGRQLQTIARLIGARGGMGLQKQCFFCSIGGFDTHGDDQLQQQNQLFGEISAAVTAFHQATVELGVENEVTLFSATDFGRTFRSNGQGTDHGWGSHQFAVGGAVRGGQILGTFNDLTPGGPDDVGNNGVWIPTTGVDQFGADLGRWFGASESVLREVFPRLSYFNPTIGLMA